MCACISFLDADGVRLKLNGESLKIIRVRVEKTQIQFRYIKKLLSWVAIL